MSQNVFEVIKKVYLADTDATQIVYYGRHLEWLEMARIEFIAAVYKPLTRMIAEDQISFIPMSVHIDYKAPAVFEDLLTIRLWIEAIEKIRIVLAYQVVRQTDAREDIISEAKISMLCINTEKGNRPSKIPEILVGIFREWTKQVD